MNDMTPTYLFGHEGIAVGSIDGEWLFDGDGEPIGFLSDHEIFSVARGKRVGRYVGRVVYDANHRPLAHAENARTNLLRPRDNRLTPLMPRLRPRGENVREKSIPLDKLLPFSLCRSLNELEAF